MLNTLEQKGSVTAQYRLSEMRVGRSSIVFETTEFGRTALLSTA